MRRLASFALCASILLTSITAVGQEMPNVEPTKEHLWLKKFEGQWKTVSNVVQDGQAGPVLTGNIHSKMLGKFWVLNSMDSKIGDFEVQGRQTIGYDRTKKQFVGTWIDNTNDFIWHYTGTLDAGGKVLALVAEGPDMSEPDKQALYRDMYEFVSDDEIKLTSSVQGPDDKWIDFMAGTATRVTASAKP